MTAVYAVGTYQGRLQRAIVSYKYRHDLRWARPFAALIAGFLARHATWFEEFSVLCPVPALPGHGPGAAWPHLDLVCQELQAIERTIWPVEHLVDKTRAAGPMCGRSRRQRERMGRGQLLSAFAVPRPGAVAGRRIILVDDVCVSGQTLASVAGVLAGAGAAEVVGLVLARPVWRARGSDRGPARRVGTG